VRLPQIFAVILHRKPFDCTELHCIIILATTTQTPQTIWFFTDIDEKNGEHSTIFCFSELPIRGMVCVASQIKNFTVFGREFLFVPSDQRMYIGGIPFEQNECEERL
jgi:hypothetical protein